MKRLMIVLLCIWNTVNAQVSDSESDYLNYYRSIATAEAAVMNDNYPEALNIYQKTFETFSFNNPIDCYIAAQVASYVGDTVRCFQVLKKGLCFGLPIQTIHSNPHLKKCSEKISQETIDSCWAIYQNNIDHKARARSISLIRRDQEIIHNVSKGSIYNSDGFTLKQEYVPVWDSLINEVIALIKSSGFPAQKIIGTQNGEDSLFTIGPNSVFVFYLFVHHGRAWKQVSELLWSELKKGNITPQMYAVIYESASGLGPYQTSILYFASRPCQEKACRKLVRERLSEINKARQEIGLCSYEVMDKKFESTAAYRKWIHGNINSVRSAAPVFDFQCDLNFQGNR